MISLVQLFSSFWNTVRGQDEVMPSAEFFNWVNSETKLEMEKQQIVGLSLALIRNGQIIHQDALGFADKDYQLKAEVSTFYRIASISKTITALAVLHASERGIIDLKADIRRYVPEYPEKAGGPITIEQLMACEGGVQQYQQISPFDLQAQVDYINNHPSDYDPIEAISVFANQKLLSPPGKVFNYSTFSFNLLGAALERAAGIPFEDYINENIRKPLHMPYLQPEFRSKRPYPNQSAWYRVQQDSLISDKGTGFDYEDVSWKLPGGGYTATVTDVALLAQSIFTSNLLSRTTTQQFFTIRELNGKPTWYGMGLFLSKKKGRLMASQFGHQAGARSLIYLSPETNDAVVLLSNTYGTDLLPLGQRIMEKLMSLPKPEKGIDVSIRDTLAKIFLNPMSGTQSTNAIKLTWTKVPQAYAYKIQWSRDSSFIKSKSVKVVENTSVVIPDLPFKTEIFFRIKAVNPYLYEGIEGDWSEPLAVFTGSSTPSVKLPYSESFEGPPFVHMGDTLIKYGNGVEWKFDRTDAGMHVRGGRFSLAPKGGGWTLDVFQGADRASGYLIMQCCLADIESKHLYLNMDLLFHGDSADYPQLLVWLRGGIDDPWVFLPDAVAQTDDKGHISNDIISTLTEHGQQLTHQVQIRFGFYGDNEALSVMPQPAITLLNCNLSVE